MTDRRAYMTEYKRRARAGEPTSRVARLEAVLVMVRDELANSNTEKGRKLHAAAVEALG